MNRGVAGLVLAGVVILTGSSIGEEPAAKAKAGTRQVADPLKFPQDPKEALAAARWLEKAYVSRRPPEAVRMLIAIANGTWAQGDGGWFGPCETRYTWDWLTRHHGVKNGFITRKQFRGPSIFFHRLDRDRDGRITAEDLDWSERSRYVQQADLVEGLFRRINAKRDGKITQDHLLAFFKAASGGKDHLTLQDLQDALLSAPPAPFAPGDAPSPEILVRSLFAGELGSLNEGPVIEQSAPDFTLKTPDGKTTVQLSKLIGPRPVVLVLGNYTCAPFRRTAMAVEELYQRCKDQATFVGVYVREAHPTDGWAMSVNAKMGVAVKQPRTYKERTAVCTQFCQLVQPSFPYVVDEMNDPVGNAYSGMPGRLYVIDPKGKVAYKSGRGPFGFNVRELEQALVMSLLEFPAVKKPTEKLEETLGKKP